MPFGVVSGVGQGIGVLDGVAIIEGKGQFWGCKAFHCNQWGLCGVAFFAVRGGDAALPTLLSDFLSSSGAWLGTAVT